MPTTKNYFSFTSLLIDFTDQNMADFSGAGTSPTAAPVVMTDRVDHGDMMDPKPTGSLHRRKRRRAGRGIGDGRLLERALADFLSWQQVMEERYLSLEEVRLQQEAQAEERREQQEERRMQQDREHELRVLSLVTGVLSAARGTSDSTSVSTSNPGPIPPASTAASEPVSLPAHHSFPPPEQEPSPGPSTAPFTSSTLRGDQTPQYSRYLSQRGNSIRQHQGILQEGFMQYQANKHDENSNPDVSLSARVFKCLPVP